MEVTEGLLDVMRVGPTIDCPECNTLLIIKDFKVHLFNEWLNSKEPLWPANGEGIQILRVKA